MRKILLAALLGGFSAGALAQASAPPQWGGFYVGAAAAHASGKNDWNELGRYRLDSRTLGAAFVGFNQQHGRFVIGAEASGVFGKLKEKTDPEYRYTQLQDVRLRVGHTYERVMVYVAGGYSRARFDDDGLRFTMTGYNLGAGVDFALGSNVILGLDYTARRFDDETCPHGRKVDGRVDTASLRLSYRF